MTTSCPSCQGMINKPPKGETVKCPCGQLVLHHPKGFLDGCYKRCQGCKKLIDSGFVRYSQHFHDECYPEHLK